MEKRNAADRMRRFYLTGMMLVLAACSPSLPPEQSQTQTPEETTMHLAHTTETTAPFIPPIDRTAPSNFETASFGLG